MTAILGLGIELEAETILPVIKTNWRSTHDASVESRAPTDDSGHIVYGATGELVIVGVEFVSPILSKDDILGEVAKITAQIKSLGEPDVSWRGSTHIHVGYGEELTMIQNLIRLWLFSESLWFKLAGMGYKYRGYTNESVYCRPMRYSQVVPVGNKFVRAIDVDKALKATKIEELWAAFGVSNPRSGADKYHPARYMGLNIYSLWLHNTIEFRVFNKSLRPRWITAIAHLCIAFAYLSMMPTIFDLPENLYPGNCGMPNEEILDVLFSLFKDFNIPINSDVRGVLNEIIASTPDPSDCSKDVITHLNTPRGMSNMESHPVVDSSIVRSSGFVDIHGAGADYDLFKGCE